MTDRELVDYLKSKGYKVFKWTDRMEKDLKSCNEREEKGEETDLLTCIDCSCCKTLCGNY